MIECGVAPEALFPQRAVRGRREYIPVASRKNILFFMPPDSPLRKKHPL
jgi:hypothetical protein